MAHRQREAFVPELLERLDRPAEVVWDTHNDRWDTGRRAMLAYQRTPDVTHWMVVQDDAIVCRDLVAGVEAALVTVPDGSPLCLYAGRVRPFRTAIQRLVDSTGAETSWLTMSEIHWGVGIAMPTERIDAMVAYGDQQTTVANYDGRISHWVQQEGLTVYYPWPSLVDHRESPSLVPGRGARGRRAHRFIGEHASALDQRYDGEVASIPPLSADKSARPSRRRPVRPRPTTR